ncbi:MAG: hypothetical protein QOG23_6062 [Blastocatellia bacterium]|nr:hypothetical protein [Blastocatellia bacterium]
MTKNSREYLLAARLALAFLVVASTAVALIGDFFTRELRWSAGFPWLPEAASQSLGTASLRLEGVASHFRNLVGMLAVVFVEQL